MVCILEQVRIHRFLEKAKRKHALNKNSEEGTEPEVKEEERLRKKVNVLMKKNKLQQVRKIVKHHDDSMSWGQVAQAKVYKLC